jgi:CRP/FNR family transcriptional regulator, cyclic AMP receptor protein
MDGSTHQEKRRIFEQHFLLKLLSPCEIETLLSYSRVERYPAGREIFPKGAPGRSMMAVLRGMVSIASLSPEGKKIVFNSVHPGEIFGEIAMLDGEERTAIATAMEDCELLVLNRRDFMPLLEKHADMCIVLLKVLCQRLRQTSEQVEDVLFRHLGARIAKALVQLAKNTGRKDLRDAPIELHLTQQDLADIVGGTRESVNKHLNTLEKARLIELGKSTIVIRNHAALERMV